ncbi:MAG: hypothetical protein JRN68_06245 [Nitrososphaerota archaeon]|nr:hypothetical protein [Nitrososphaerota archaeon]
MVVAQQEGRASAGRELVSFARMNEIYSELPENSLVRRLVLSEPDTLPRDVAKKRAFLYLEMLEKEKGTIYSTLRR